MEKKDIFALTISALAIILLLVTPVNLKIKELGNQITGFAVEDISIGESKTEEPIDLTDEEETQSPDLDLTDDTVKKAEITSESLRTPEISSILNTLQLSSAEKTIIGELAKDYLETQAKQTRYTPSQKELIPELPKEVKLSIPEKQTDIILAIEDQKYPKIKIRIKA